MATFVTKSGVKLTLNPVAEMVIGLLYTNIKKPQPPTQEIDGVSYNRLDDPDYIAQLAEYNAKVLEAIQELYIEFGIEDFEFDVEKVKAFRAKGQRLNPPLNIHGSDKTIYVKYFLCPTADEYNSLLTALRETTHPSHVLQDNARELFPGSVPGPGYMDAENAAE